MKHIKNISIAIIAISILVIVVGCGSGDAPLDTPVPETDESTDLGEATTEQSAFDPYTDDGVLVINMETRGSRSVNDPVGIHVEPGTTVRFINASGMHSATAYHADNNRENRIPPGAESWDTSLMTRRNATFEITLTVEGVYDYYCIPHETMGHVGRIIVGDPDAFPAQPTDDLPSGAAGALPPVDLIIAETIVRP